MLRTTRYSALALFLGVTATACGTSTDAPVPEAQAPAAAPLETEADIIATCAGRKFFALSDEVRPWCFQRSHKAFASALVEKGDHINELPRSEKAIDLSYEFYGETHTLTDFAQRTKAMGVLVLKNGEIVHEEYFLGADEHSRFNSFSVGKSVVSTLVGLAIEEGYIDSVDDKLTKYLPHYADSGYSDVTIKQALQMSSGVKFIEDYANEDAEFARFFNGVIADVTISSSEMMVSLPSIHSPGTVFNYSSGESTVLSELVERVTGMPATQYLSEKIWSKVGMEQDAYWWVDKDGAAMGAGALHMPLRDYARFGQLMLDRGAYKGEQIISESWIDEATTPDAPHLQPGKLYPGFPIGYQYQWWTSPGDDQHPYIAVGVFGQYIYINPAHDLVIAIVSARSKPDDDLSLVESLAMFSGIENKLP